jgi:hypothetical protein
VVACCIQIVLRHLHADRSLSVVMPDRALLAFTATRGKNNH